MTVTTENATQNPVVEASFEHGLEQTVLPGRGLTLCAPTRRDLYQNRLADTTGDVAEMFQVNARWRRGAFQELPDVEEQKALRRWFLNAGRVFDMVGSGPGPMLPLAQISAPLGPALATMARMGADSGLLFAADIIVIADGWSHLLPAGQEHLVRLRTFTQQQRRDLVAAISPDARHAFDEASCHVAVVASPQRVQVTHGPRGYRNALMEVGMLIGNIGSLMATRGLHPTVAVDFIDTTVDHILDQDGVERFVAALISLNPQDPKGDDSHDHH
ncbi:MAG: hypothetical protein Q4D96_12705 [Propionibacteriaceae bacterium]|nr:hypothetical protein [Propionibacteriaceae bacterium]